MILFRENYKNAMNDIKADDRILNSLLLKASLKTEKKSVFNRQKFYTLSTVAAAVAVVLISVKVTDKAIVNNEVGMPDVMVENSIVSEIPEENTNNKTGEIAMQRKSADNTDGLSQKLTDTASQIQETADTKNSAIFDIESGGRNANARLNAMPATTSMTESEYFNYLGKNILDSLKIPDDLIKENNVISILKDIDTGEITQDFHKFEYRGEKGRYIAISTEKSEENSTDWEITSVNESVIATKTTDNIKITVEHCNLSEAESQELFNSFK